MAPRPVFFEHPSSIEHDTGDHPEQAARLVVIKRELERRAWLGWERVRSPRVDLEVLTAVHSPAFVAAIERVTEAGGGALDSDTVVSSGSFEAALRGSGGAVAMVERLLASGAGARGFSAHRPPGHHASRARAMGFCLFNHIAVAARWALDVAGLERVMVLDWDVHHGNGTSDIFWESAEVLLVSIHQWPLYPGSGRADEVGTGAGRGYTVNLPVPAATGDDVYVSLVRDVVAPLARRFAPELVLVSAGFDAHVEDPLASCAVTEAGFAAMAALMGEVSDELGVPLGCVLEGGYALGALARSVVAVMETLGGGLADAAAPGAAFGEPVALARDALVRLAEFWPGLG